MTKSLSSKQFQIVWIFVRHECMNNLQIVLFKVIVNYNLMNESFMAPKKLTIHTTDALPLTLTEGQHESQTLKLQSLEKRQRNNRCDGYFLDQVITFRKKNADHEQSQNSLAFLRDQTLSIKQPNPKNELKKREQRAKTQLFEYSDQIIQGEIDSQNLKEQEVVRLPNLSSQLSAFKQEKNSFLKVLVSKKYNQKLNRYMKPLLKSLSTQISCEKVWLKRKESFTLNTKSSTQDVESGKNDKDGDEQSQKKASSNDKMMLYKKAVVLSLPQNYQAAVIEQKKSSKKLQQIKFKKIGVKGSKKQPKSVNNMQQKQSQNAFSLIVSNTNEKSAIEARLQIQKRTSSQNQIHNNSKRVMRAKGRIKSTCSEYIGEKKKNSIQGLNLLNISLDKYSKKHCILGQEHKKDESQSLASRTKKKIMSIFKKIKEKKIIQNNNAASAASLSSLKVITKKTQNPSCFKPDELESENIKAKSSVLRPAKQDIKLNCRNIIDSLKLFSESKKTLHILNLLNNQKRKFDSGVLSSKGQASHAAQLSASKCLD